MPAPLVKTAPKASKKSKLQDDTLKEVAAEKTKQQGAKKQRVNTYVLSVKEVMQNTILRN